VPTVLPGLVRFASMVAPSPTAASGSEHSVGHYLDLGGAVLGLTLFPIGYLLHALTNRHPNVQENRSPH